MTKRRRRSARGGSALASAPALVLVVGVLAAGLASAEDGVPAITKEQQFALDMQGAVERAERDHREFEVKLGLKPGPLVGDMGMATIDVPEGFAFTGAEGARRWAELTANPVSGKEVALLGPRSQLWLVLFEFDDVGYVRDDEKDTLDADALLQDIRDGTAEFNEQRKAQGASTLSIIGWEQRPTYNEAQHALEWCVRAESDGDPSLNFNTRVLGRDGVMSVTLMFGGLTTLPDVLPTFRHLLKSFKFKTGHTYGEYRDGDKLAEYGLGALVAGGGLPLAAKSGLLAKILKPLLVLLAAAGAGITRLFGRRRRHGRDTPASTNGSGNAPS